MQFDEALISPFPIPNPQSPIPTMLHALTICQPWAWAVLGPKRHENRTWGTSYRGPLLIHAGRSRKWMEAGCRVLRRIGHKVPDDLPFGAIVGQVDLVDCLPAAEVQPASVFATGPMCLVFANPRRLATPIPFRGSQGLFGIPDRAMAYAIWDLSDLQYPISNPSSSPPSNFSEQILSQCPCGQELMVLIQPHSQELRVCAHRDGCWVPSVRCPVCDRDFSLLSAAYVKENAWPS